MTQCIDFETHSTFSETFTFFFCYLRRQTFPKRKFCPDISVNIQTTDLQTISTPISCLNFVTKYAEFAAWKSSAFTIELMFTGDIFIFTACDICERMTFDVHTSPSFPQTVIFSWNQNTICELHVRHKKKGGKTRLGQDAIASPPSLYLGSITTCICNG